MTTRLMRTLLQTADRGLAWFEATLSRVFLALAAALAGGGGVRHLRHPEGERARPDLR